MKDLSHIHLEEDAGAAVPAVVVIGASAGGIDVLCRVVQGLPASLEAAVLITLHLSASADSHLPTILGRCTALTAAHAVDGELLRGGRIYVAVPDQHLMVDDSRVRLSRGPRLNGVRPSIDALFESAASAFGPATVGVVLSGMLDDGTVGLTLLKEVGGHTIVQDPGEALFPSMPESALRFADPDESLPAEHIPGAILAALAQTGHRTAKTAGTDVILTARRGGELSTGEQIGHPTGLSCPDCGGALWERRSGPLEVFRCRVGHAYSIDSLVGRQQDELEACLWSAVVALEEHADLSRRMFRRMMDTGLSKAAERSAADAKELHRRADLIRDTIVDLLGRAPRVDKVVEG